MFPDLLIRLRSLFRRNAVEAELDEELRFHIDHQIEKFVRAGLPLAEATRRARLIIGTPDKIKEECRDARGTRFLEDLWHDIRYAVRNLAKNPGFTAVALLSLTLGIGGNTTIFTLVKAVFLQSIPAKNPSTLVVVYSTRQNANGRVLHFLYSSYPNAKDYREKNDVFSGLSMFVDANDEMDVPGSNSPVFVRVQLVNWDFFDILGVRPLSGRTFAADEDQVEGAHPVVMLSYALWNTQLGADPDILGKTIRLNGRDYTAIGVMPKEFKQVGAAIGSPALWAPMAMHAQLVTDVRKDWFSRRRSAETYMVARLKPGMSFANASASVAALGDRLAELYPTDNSGRNVELVPLSETNIYPENHRLYALAGTLMMSIVGMVLLIACGNVANLLLARSMQRHREFAIRLSLGASRWRIIRQLLTESLLLGLTAAALGIALAYWARNLVWALLPLGMPQGLDFSLDGRVLLFTLGISIAATLLFGLVPALQASSPRQMAALRDHTDSPSGANRWYSLRGILVTAQISFSSIALVGAALFIHSLRNAQRVDPGFETTHELVVLLNPGAAHYPQGRAEQYYRDATEKVRALPMVTDAGISKWAPFEPDLMFTTFPEGVDTSDPRNGSPIPANSVAPGYFSASGIPLLRGRDVSDRDNAETDHIVVVNQALTDHLWPGKDPIGKKLSFSTQTWKAEIVGEVGTVKAQTLGEPPQPVLYFALKQMYSPSANLYVRTKGDPVRRAIPSVQAALKSLDPSIPLRRIATVSYIMDQQLSSPRFAARLLAGFGALALLLAAVGTYGVMSYSVSQRTQEIGIRMALGAQRRDALRLILSNGMTIVFVGTLAGLGASIFLSRSVNSLLYGIGSFDAAAFLAATALLVAVALVACWLPARRAMRVDPIVALRYE